MDAQIKIKIKGVEYIIKQGFRSLLLFEEMTGKNSSNATDTITDVTKLFYCFLKGCNVKTFTFEFDEFIDLLDDDPIILQDFADYLKNLNKQTGTNATPPKKKRKQ